MEVPGKVLDSCLTFLQLVLKTQNFFIMKKFFFTILAIAFISSSSLFAQGKLKYADEGLAKMNSISVMTWKKQAFGKTGKLEIVVYESTKPYAKLYTKQIKVKKDELLQVMESMLERGVIPIMTFWEGDNKMTMYLSADYFPNTNDQ